MDCSKKRSGASAGADSRTPSTDSSAPSPSKKHRNDQKNYYKGVLKRYCICPNPKECGQAFRNFVDIGDNKRCGYHRLSSASGKGPAGMEAARQRANAYHHLRGASTAAPIIKGPDDHKYVGFWHYHPSVLQSKTWVP